MFGKIQAYIDRYIAQKKRRRQADLYVRGEAHANEYMELCKLYVAEAEEALRLAPYKLLLSKEAQGQDEFAHGIRAAAEQTIAQIKGETNV